MLTQFLKQYQTQNSSIQCKPIQILQPSMMHRRCGMLGSMAASNFILITLLISFINLSPTSATEDSNHHSDLQTYIVHVEPPRFRFLSESTDDLISWYESFLPEGSVRGSKGQSRLVYAYRNVITGFAARLTPDEVKEMEKKDGFVSARPRKILPLHTTHTPDFLGLKQNFGLWNNSNMGKGVIIGVLDTGVLPNHPSFADQGVPPPPRKWKGKCDFDKKLCNNKLIGARTFLGKVGPPPFDENGHGTHTAGTAAGNFVNGANVLGNARGTSVGMAPLAHLAIYKVCSSNGCADNDILAAMDTAIDDGVDVLSLSLGAPRSVYYNDGIALGAFAAVKRGIFVSCSAGNSGPSNSTLSNEAPWILTVAASTLDRTIKATAKLGSGQEFDGESLYQPNFPSTQVPLVDASKIGTSPNAAFCARGTLPRRSVSGKIVLCQSGGISVITKGQTVRDAGGVAMIVMNSPVEDYSIMAQQQVLPATVISYVAGLAVRTYINSNPSPTATILFKGTTIEPNHAPMVSYFSSRGPSITSPGILKPDITGPGVNILAAWPFPLANAPPSNLTFNIISGTSMSCPHLSGIAALLKVSHPDWSPAAIRSAIMTTANLLNLENKPIVDQSLAPADMFAIGAGHVNPARANDPGLVYDLQSDDYINYLCGLGYTDKQVGTIARRTVNCDTLPRISEAQLNYPSFSIALRFGQDQTYTRTVTNVGAAGSSYWAEISFPSQVEVSVQPAELKFSNANQKLTYQVKFRRTSAVAESDYVQGYLKWISDDHIVTSPLSVRLL